MMVVLPTEDDGMIAATSTEAGLSGSESDAWETGAIFSPPACERNHEGRGIWLVRHWLLLRGYKKIPTGL